METSYEWDVELTTEDDEVVDHDYVSCLSAALAAASAECPAGHKYCIVLVRNVGNQEDGLLDRQWAYLDSDGRLPSHFDSGAKVPAKYRRETERA